MNATCYFSFLILLYLMAAKPSSAGIYHIDGTLHCRLLDAATLDTFPLGNTTLQVFDEDGFQILVFCCFLNFLIK